MRTSVMIRLNSLLIVVSVLIPALCFGQQPANPHASNEARVVLRLLSKLSDPEQHLAMIGQNSGHTNVDVGRAYLSAFKRLSDHTGRWPAMLTIDLGMDKIPANQRTPLSLALDHWKQGGVVMFGMHPRNPWRRTEVYDVHSGDFSDLWNPNTEVYRLWHKDLDNAAFLLSQLQDQGVVVLWRPLHEANGGWFWWGGRQHDSWIARQDYVRLWREMFRYFTEEKKLNNLLWVYAPNVQMNTWQRSAAHFYPGTEYVDVLGLDWYTDDLSKMDKFHSYSELAALNKPMGLTEIGPETRQYGKFDTTAVMAAIENDYPRLGFFVFWHSWPGNKAAIIDNQKSRELMLNPRVLTRIDTRRIRAELSGSTPSTPLRPVSHVSP